MYQLYLAHQGSVLRRTGQRLVIDNHEEPSQVVRMRDVERVVLMGNVQMTASAMAGLLDVGIDVTLLAYSGQYRGRLVSASSKDVFLHATQFRLIEDVPFRLGVARRIVSGKLRNMSRLIHRHVRNHPAFELDEAIAHIQHARSAAISAKSLPSLLGVEGDGSRAYFDAFAHMLRGDLAFHGRSRRPPRDPVNALLSFGYTLLTGEIDGELGATGLDTHVGLLHELDYGRPSLTLDLLEEFRAPVIDRLTLDLVNRRIVNESDFEGHGEAGVYLNASGREKYLPAYHECIEGPIPGQSLGVRDLIRRQATRLRDAIRGHCDYSPFRLT